MERLATRCDGHPVMAWEREEKYTMQEWIDTVLVCGEVYEADQNKYGAVCWICNNGQRLGVKPGEFELCEEPEGG